MATDKNSFLTKFVEPFSSAGRLRLEKSRLEAFLAAVPGEYCGFASDGSVVFSDRFCGLLDLPKIETIYDIQSKLSTSDSAALEGFFYKLQEEGKAFSLTASSLNGDKLFRLSGSRGQALDGGDRFDIVWLEDVTEDNREKAELQKNRDRAETEADRLQAVLDSMSMPLWMRGPDTEITWCNKAYAKMLGTSPATVIAKQMEIQISSKDKVKPPKDIARKALTEGKAQSIRAHVIVSGDRLLMDIVEMPLATSDRTMGIAQDVTREEELDNEMQRHLAANKSLLEQLRSAIGIFGPDHSLEFFNSSFAESWGLEDQWLNTRPKLGDILEKLRETRRLPEQTDFRKYKQGWLDMFTRLIDAHEDMMYLPDGSALRMLVVPHPMGGLMMTFEDVTSRLELESSYNTLIAVQKETLDNLAEGVAVYGGDGRLKLWNPSFAELWGLNPETLDGQPHISGLIEKMNSFFEKEGWDDRKKDLISHGIDRQVKEGRLARTNDTLLEYTTVPLPDGGVLVSYFDITDTVRVENALREKNAALEAAEQLKLDFLANVSYQLRTPLSTIMGFAEILENQYFGDLNPRQREYASGIQEAGERLLSLVDDILDLSTIEAGYMELSMEDVDVQDMLQGLYDLTQEWARKQKLQVTLNCTKDIGTMKADARRIKQVMLNLIRNAINFTQEGGTITITAARTKDDVEISVSDTGVGIPKEDLKRIFEPFERVQASRTDATTAASRGAGLGLSLVKNIVELHGGHIKIDSEQGKGTSVKLSIPLKAVVTTEAAI